MRAWQNKTTIFHVDSSIISPWTNRNVYLTSSHKFLRPTSLFFSPETRHPLKQSVSNDYHSFLFSLDSSRLILHICYFQKYCGGHWRSWFLAHGIPSPLKSPQHAHVLLPLASKNHFLCCHLLSFQIQISRGLYLADLLCLQKLYQDIPIYMN